MITMFRVLNDNDLAMIILKRKGRYEKTNGNDKEIIRHPNCCADNLLYMLCYFVCTVNSRELGKDQRDWIVYHNMRCIWKQETY